MSRIRIFINEAPLTVPAGTSVRGAVTLHDADLAAALDDGTAFVTDGRGIDLDGDAVLHGGSILRVAVSRRRLARDRHADA